jgi:hypothetical protein
MTATGSGRPMKAIAADLDWSPSDLAHRTTLGGDSARPFPADDEHLVGLMRTTGDYSVLATIADLCGYQIEPKKERVGAMVADLNARLVGFQADVKQLQLALGEVTGRKR